MSQVQDPWAGTPWSNSKNAPWIPLSLYQQEKANFVGVLAGAIFYGIVVVLFFRCIFGLFQPANRERGGVKWVLVVHTATIFSFLTILTALNINAQSISYINNRAFPGLAWPPGPLAYWQCFMNMPLIGASNVICFLICWFADGLLLYRFCIIYAMNYRIVAFPCLLYLASLATGIVAMYYEASPFGTDRGSEESLGPGLSYLSCSISLNVLLTAMIVGRLVLHRRNVQKVLGTAGGAYGMYEAVSAMMIESCVLYTTCSILYAGTWAAHAHTPAGYVFFQVIAAVQVIATFLITLRVANRSALTNEGIVSGSTGSIEFGNQRKAGGGTVSLSIDPVGSMGGNEGAPTGAETGVEGGLKLHHDEASII